jgi:hypothetical protein
VRLFDHGCKDADIVHAGELNAPGDKHYKEAVIEFFKSAPA